MTNDYITTSGGRKYGTVRQWQMDSVCGTGEQGWGVEVAHGPGPTPCSPGDYGGLLDIWRLLVGLCGNQR